MSIFDIPVEKVIENEAHTTVYFNAVEFFDDLPNITRIVHETEMKEKVN